MLCITWAACRLHQQLQLHCLCLFCIFLTFSCKFYWFYKLDKVWKYRLTDVALMRLTLRKPQTPTTAFYILRLLWKILPLAAVYCHFNRDVWLHFHNTNPRDFDILSTTGFTAQNGYNTSDFIKSGLGSLFSHYK